MTFKIASSILALFSIIGLGGSVLIDFDSLTLHVIFIVIYVLIPAYGAYGTFVKSPRALFVCITFFTSQSVRSIGGDSLFPHLAPITVSFPFGDFSNGQGYLIDYFAICMVILLVYLLKVIHTTNKESKRSD